MIIPIVILSMEDNSDRGFMLHVYTAHYAMMKRQAVIIMKDATQAEDVLQTVCLKLIERLEVLREMDPRALASYIVVTTRHTAYKHMHLRYERDRKSTPSLDEEGGLVPVDETVNIEESVVFQMGIQDLKKALCRLPQKYQDVLEFKYMLEMDDKEIGEALGVGADSVRTYLTRARKAAYSIAKEMGF